MASPEDETTKLELKSINFTALGVIIVILIFLYGFIGSMHIMKLNVIDALYFTFETIATLGYGDIVPITPVQKIFVTSLAFAGIGIITVIISTIMRNITLKLTEARSDTIMKRKLKQMTGHYVLCGYGRVGTVVLEELMKRNQKTIVIDSNWDVIERLKGNEKIASNENIVILYGDATAHETMEKFNIKEANGLILTTGSDVNNIYIALSIRDITDDSLWIVARASRKDNVNRLYNAGADRVISPEASGGIDLFLASVQPYIIRVTNKHKSGETKEEIDIIIDNGCTIEDIEYHFPGIREPFSRAIGVKSKEELLLYSRTNKSALNSQKLMDELNGGLHSHKISGPDKESLKKVVDELKKAKLLVGVNMSNEEILKINNTNIEKTIKKYDIKL